MNLQGASVKGQQVYSGARGRNIYRNRMARAD